MLNQLTNTNTLIFKQSVKKEGINSTMDDIDENNNDPKLTKGIFPDLKDKEKESDELSSIDP